MALTSKVLINFSRYKDGDLLTKAHHIVTSITGNSHYPTPLPTLADVKASVEAYERALANAANGGRTLTTIKRQARSTLETLLCTLALYVQLEGDGDIPVILSSGFDVRKLRGTIGILAKPMDCKLDATIKGTVRIHVASVYGAYSYQFEYTETPVTDTSVWIIVSNTAASLFVTGLTSGKEYAFRVTGIGSNTTRVYSDVISVFVS